MVKLSVVYRYDPYPIFYKIIINDLLNRTGCVKILRYESILSHLDSDSRVVDQCTIVWYSGKLTVQKDRWYPCLPIGQTGVTGQTVRADPSDPE